MDTIKTAYVTINGFSVMRMAPPVVSMTDSDTRWATEVVVGRPLKTIALEASTREWLRKGLLTIGDPLLDPDRSLLALYSIFTQLPADLIAPILEFAKYHDSPAVVLLTGLPQDSQLPPTQNDGLTNRRKRTYLSEGCLLGLAQLLGESLGFMSEKGGRLVHDIVPVPGGEETLSNQGSTRLLGFHNDIYHDESGRYHHLNPDFLILICLRADPTGRAYTACAAATDICNYLDDFTLNVLRQPLYRMNAPQRYCLEFAGGADVLSEQVPIITGPLSVPEISVASNGVVPLNGEADSALNRLKQACDSPSVVSKALLQPGQAILINNRKALHGRSAFQPRYDGTDRWLQRAQARRSLWELRHKLARGNRVYS